MKNFSDFHKKNATADGYAHHCKTCVHIYDKQRNKGKLIFPEKTIEGLIHCRRCERYLEKQNFWGGFTYCRECSKTIGHRNNLKRFNLTIEEYIALEKSQNGLCKICGGTDTRGIRLTVDHNHSCCDGAYSCGKCIRGLICGRCNKTLGMINDNIDLLQSMILYLQKHR